MKYREERMDTQGILIDGGAPALTEVKPALDRARKVLDVLGHNCHPITPHPWAFPCSAPGIEPNTVFP